jgi:hypothetical protein
MNMTKPLQEWKSYASHNGGVNNLAVCRLNHPGDGSAAVAVGTSLKDMDAAVKNAHRNLRRSLRRSKDRSGISCTCHLAGDQVGPVPHYCPACDGDYMSFLASNNCD